ncbi:hypothetical protein GOP47_0019986 [Adiantum capillus-veneris]|uniref:Uncharacterized protein n=1 Tax=Adiantum capillus-veneris TaxID=13818 RepID=A0A9D4ZA61_ADICA|nr:hypothetical protein GOP47_0019986 [Adiantum capillus-veneris]
MVLRKEITSSACGFMKDVEKQALKKVDTLRMAAQRLSFRFLMVLVSKNVEDHVRAGVHLAFSTLADSGWLLIMVSTAGEAIGWVERFCRVAEMVVHRRILVLHHGAYGHFESFGGPIECLCSVLFMVHRVGYVLPLLRRRKRSREDPSTSLDIDDEGDMPSRANPFDD